ncbi:MAG: hypothetical protein SFU56_16055 [Capsulimonadales bacterium]|nr:hypothetical protein [Capsulimonadales bacterium]
MIPETPFRKAAPPRPGRPTEPRNDFLRPEIEPDQPATADEMIQDYLDYLCAPLAGIVPFRERQRVREDALYVIGRQRNAYLIEGLTEPEATRLAIARYGESREVGQRVVECWFEHQPCGPLARYIGLGNAIGLICFGQATLWGMLLVLWRIHHPEERSLWFAGLSPGQVRQFIPEPLPIPEPNLALGLLLGIMLLGPVLAGALVGHYVPVHPVRAVRNVLFPLTCASFVLGVYTLPASEGLLFALCQLLWWLPVGTLTAHTVGVITWRSRCRYRSVSDRSVRYRP